MSIENLSKKCNTRSIRTDIIIQGVEFFMKLLFVHIKIKKKINNRVTLHLQGDSPDTRAIHLQGDSPDTRDICDVSELFLEWPLWLENELRDLASASICLYLERKKNRFSVNEARDRRERFRGSNTRGRGGIV